MGTPYIHNVWEDNMKNANMKNRNAVNELIKNLEEGMKRVTNTVPCGSGLRVLSVEFVREEVVAPTLADAKVTVTAEEAKRKANKAARIAKQAKKAKVVAAKRKIRAAKKAKAEAETAKITLALMEAKCPSTAKQMAKEEKSHEQLIAREKKILSLLNVKLKNIKDTKVIEEITEVVDGKEVPVTKVTYKKGKEVNSMKLLSLLSKKAKAKKEETVKKVSYKDRLVALGLSVKELSYASEYSYSTVLKAVKGEASVRAIKSIDETLYALERLEKDHLFEELRELDQHASRDGGMGAQLSQLRAKSQNLHAHFEVYAERSEEELMAEGGFSFSDSLTRDTARKDLTVKEMKKRLEGFSKRHDLVLEGELEQLVAEQFKDNSTGVLGFANKLDRNVNVSIQELGYTPEGKAVWRTKKNREGLKYSMKIDLQEFSEAMESGNKDELVILIEDTFNGEQGLDLVLDGGFQRALFTGAHLHTWTGTNHDVSKYKLVDGQVCKNDDTFSQTQWVDLEAINVMDTVSGKNKEDHDVDYSTQEVRFLAMKPSEADVQADHEFAYAMSKHNDGIATAQADSIARSIAEIADIKDQIKEENLVKKITNEVAQQERRNALKEQTIKEERRARALTLILENKEVARLILGANLSQSRGDTRSARAKAKKAVELNGKIAKDICVKMKAATGENYLVGSVYKQLSTTVKGKEIAEGFDPKAMELLQKINNEGRGAFSAFNGDKELLNLVVTTGQNMFKLKKQTPVADKKVWMDLVRMNRAA